MKLGCCFDGGAQWRPVKGARRAGHEKRRKEQQTSQLEKLVCKPFSFIGPCSFRRIL